MSTVISPIERIPLSSGFRFVHEPLGTSPEVEWHRFVGRHAELDDLVSRIVLSDGGAFLLTGYRGVGKTTFVNRVIHEVRQRLPLAKGYNGESIVVDIAFNFARPLKPVELLYHIVRGLHRRLTDLDILRRLEPTLRQDLELAVARTSATVAIGNEIEATNEIGTGDGPIGILGASIPFQLKRSLRRVANRDLTYLAYDEKSAEHDLIAIAQRLTAGYIDRPPRFLPWLRGHGRRVPLKVVMVFDELDKLDDDRMADGRPQPALDRILGTLKNLFTTSGLTFIFVAGKGLHERWLEDLSRGDSVFESVFAHAQYLSGMWTDVDRLCDSLVGSREPAAPLRTAAYDAFRKYLAYKGRGIPRRTIRGFNEFVRWDNAAPRLEFDPSDVRRFRFYAGLLDTLVNAEEELLGRYRGEGSVEQLDKRRLGLYYATDWILQREQQEFTLDDLVKASQRMSRLITPVEEAAPGELQHLVDVLLRGEYVEVVGSVPGTIVAGVRVAPRSKRYRLPRRRLLELGAFLGVFEQEAQALFKTAVPAPPPAGVPDTDVSWRTQYEVVSQIGRGAMSTVYLVRDKETGRQAALKELSRELTTNPELRSRAEVEGKVLLSLKHPGIVKVFDLWVRHDAVALVMEYLQGLPLGEVLKRGPVTDVSLVARLMGDLANAVDYIHQQGIVWRDPKPGNVFITPEGRVVILDFGIARQGAGSGRTEVGTVLGTPGYMSPEQARGEPVDSRSDVFGLGVLFFEVLTGRRPFAGTTLFEFISHLTSANEAPAVSSIAPGTEMFDGIVSRCLAKNPGDRMSARELRDLLADNRTPPSDLGSFVMSLRTQSTGREEIHTVFAPRPAAAAPQPPGVAPAAAPPSEVPVAVPGTVIGEFEPPIPYTPTSAPVPVATVAPRTATRLEFVGSDRSVSLFAKSTRLGRSSENDVVLDDPTVSRYAAEIIQGDTIIASSNTYYVKDLNSRNGVLMNGRPIEDIARLSDGDELAVGAVRLRFRYGSIR
jgi:serine/threonine-protein kinase